MNRFVLSAAVLAASAFAAPASAQEEPSFSGPWAGASAGYDRFTAGGDEDDSSEDGAVYGVALGYDANLGSVVLGVEGEITDSSVAASGSDVLEDGDELTLKAGRDLYAGFRVGLPVSESMMVFGKAGYTNQRFKTTYTLGTASEGASENIDGFRLGAGAEFDLGEPFARLEYRYSDYGSFAEDVFETSRHQVVLTAGIRF